MAWIAFIEALLKAISGVVGYLGDRRLLEAGQAEAISAGLQQSLDSIKRANDVKDAMRNNADPDFSERLRKKYERPDGE